MARIKIDYGIDLGTTNSAVCRMEKGLPVVKKIEVTDEVMPSCVYFNRRGGIVVGASAYRSMKSDKRTATKPWEPNSSNTYVEFKRTMGTDKIYHSDNMMKKGLKADYSSEELSAEVLKNLKSFITDEDFHSVVITVPAKFTVNQKTATIQAAKLAGFDHCELLQEPIAASMAYGISTGQKDGYWMVFDFGGGTFDAALLKVEDGIMQVFDTEGDNYLGGKNLDYAIVDEIIIPYLKENFVIEGILADELRKEILRDAMKTYAEDIKNKLSFQEKDDIISNLGDLGEDDEGEEIELDMTITQEDLFEAIRPHFQKAVDICKTLLERNNMRGIQLDKIILVGGPTHSPLIRQMLREQISENVDTSIDPMTAVAVGAALYASTIDAEIKDDDVEVGTIRLNVGYEATSVETREWISIQLDKHNSGANCPNKIFVELVSSDKTWSSGKNEIDENGNVIEADLIEGRANTFVILAYDELGNTLNCFPNEITIIQGSKVGAAPLPYHYGIEIWDEEKKKLVFQQIEGLEKNKPLPAIGVYNNSKTTSQLRPGINSDKLIIPIYQADEEFPKISAKLYEHAADVVIDGSEVDQLIPIDSNVELTVKANSSEVLTIEVYFPALDVTIYKELTIKKQSIDDAKQAIKDNFIEAERNLQHLEIQGVDTTDLRLSLNEVKTEHNNNSEPKMVLKHQRDVLREIEKREGETEFDRIEKELKRMFKMTEEDQKKYGGFQTGQTLDQLRTLVDEAIAKRDVKMAKDALDQVRALDYKLALVEYYVAWITGWNKRFDSIQWKDRNRARHLINSAIAIINDSPTAEKLEPYIQQLVTILPASAIPEGAKNRLKKG